MQSGIILIANRPKTIALFPLLPYNCKMSDLPRKCWYGKLLYPSPMSENFPKHSHPHYEMYFFLRGDGSYYVGDIDTDSAEKLSPYTLIVIPPDTPHCFRPLSAAEYERVVIGFDKPIVLPELQHLLPVSPRFYRLSEDHEIFKALPKLDYVANSYKIPDDMMMLQLYINEFFLRLSYTQDGAPAIEGQTHPFVQKTINYINEHIREPIDMDVLCKALFASRSHLSSIFSKYMNVPIMEYVKQRKILFAQRLIKSGKLPTEAADECGFSTYSTFFRLYKKLLDRTPEQDKSPHSVTESV